METLSNLLVVLTLAGILIAVARWSTPRVRHYLAVRRYKRMLPEMRVNEMADRITALENQLAGQKDFMQSFVHDMFALDRANSKQLGGLGDLLREMLEGRGRDIESDKEYNTRLIAVLKELYDQIDRLWDANLKALALIETAMKPTQELQDNPPETPELKSA